ncbi:MAG TPA: hypothetical protein VIP46_14855, partial [Pyrinomonadaceae bacterium]
TPAATVDPDAPPAPNIDPATAASALTTAGGAGTKESLDSCGLLGTPEQGRLSEYERAVCRLVDRIRQGKIGSADPDAPAPPDPQATFTLNLDPLATEAIFAAKLIGTEERAKFLTEAEEARTDKQVGGGPSNSGSTSLVVKGGAPTVLGLAVENGALIQSRSGTTITYRGNPVGIFKFLQGKSWDESYLEDQDDPSTRLLRRFSFGVSFDTERGREPGVFTAGRQQISGYSLRYEFVNERDPRHPKYLPTWRSFLAEEGVALTQSVADAFKALTVRRGFTDAERAAGVKREIRFRNPVLQAWLEETRRAVAAAAPADVESVFKAQLDKFPAGDRLPDDVRDTLRGFTTVYGAYLQARERLLREVAKGRVITFEYTNTREVNAPDLSNLNFIAETGIFRGRADLTANASFSFYNSRPQGGVNRVRDFQFSGQLDVPFKVRQVGNFIFSFAGKYERVVDDAIALDGTVLPGTKGDIGVGQFKLTLPFLEGTGVKFPISFTVANRTELVREQEVRGSFGFTFDLDKVLARFRPF